ncbi:MAG: signal peptide peptidase SppA [Methylobacteriaceae bacterium]|nr:signal peptide peptidase SppA [Methylobacteriaceae bacterium]MBV9635646.1 signal peptide peptidase SppA [Methylobacteriaceae bacterium]MBV9701418.1 signal peptide peptidase SppA [Methylobacteriaceae bacterium]
MPGQAAPFASTADYLVDRRRLRRRVFFWRLATLLVAIAAIVGLAAGFGWIGGPGSLQPHIARVAISGFISGDADTLKLLRDVADSHAEGVILTIDSPGGTTAGSERLYDEIRRVAAKKPVVAVVGTLAASGAYIAALGADEIVVRGNSLVGSIGVLLQNPNMTKLLDNLGIKVEEVKSSPLKAAPSPFEPTSDAARDAVAALIADSYDWFKGLVKDRRKLSDEELARVADGRVFTGRQALPLKLVDQIGGEREAIAWLEQQKGVTKGLPVRDWQPRGSLERWGFLSTAAALSQALGFDDLAQVLDRAASEIDARALDGLVSVWHAGSGS